MNILLYQRVLCYSHPAPLQTLADGAEDASLWAKALKMKRLLSESFGENEDLFFLTP